MKILIWGAANAGKNIYYSLPDDAEVTAFIDSSIIKQGKTYLGIPVIPETDIPGHDFDLLIISHTQAAAVTARLTGETGIPREKILDPYYRGYIDPRRNMLRLLGDEIRKKN
ncbi:hypothetical protein K7I13_11120 [Brucepastera parasyntrophica]|uniref:nucleoside-diphosphate sugar epimerase/dehydratase n=1 Tax=Brucepastera parasyntrophica TaxID=2880008 RepID=UPI0021096E0E|nr:hypothetical protein [Brucepastera parasyntrophica]ULQ59059.1 hypothetical protein K7I13_11120 [Brucepastera parasyntrophica]